MEDLIKALLIIPPGIIAVFFFKVGWVLWKNDPNDPLIRDANEWHRKKPDRDALRKWLRSK